MENEDKRRKAELHGLAMLHVSAQKAMYNEELKKNGNGHEPKTDIFDTLSIAEAAGPHEVASVVAALLAGATCDALNEPVDVLTDLVMALKYKTKFYDPKKEPNNAPVEILNKVYNASLDEVNKALCSGDIPSDVADKVCDFIYE